MSLCPTCKSSFYGDEQFCPRDGTPLRSSLPEDPLAGRVLSGRYRLVEVIGRGGMGAVYRAHHILMDKPVAVKVLRQELASDTEAVARFHREARSASRLDHEQIIRVSDFGQTDDGLLFLVMELLDGENLAQVLRRGAVPWRRAATIVRDVALGLSHAHEQGVIHRDLKPENIVLVRRGKTRQGVSVKVLDFGLAKLMPHAPTGTAEDGEGAEPDLAVQSLTRTGVVFGTPEYMSPEQAEGRSLDARTDIYALGVVAYQMLSGKLPFSAPTFLALIAKTVNEPPPPLADMMDPGATPPPGELEELVLRCLAKAPEDRPQSAEEIADTLDGLLGRFPDEAMRSGEVSASFSPAPSGSASGGRRPDSGAAVRPVAGGIARTVQRHLPPGQAPRTTPRMTETPPPSAAPSPSGTQPPVEATSSPSVEAVAARPLAAVAEPPATSSDAPPPAAPGPEVPSAAVEVAAPVRRPSRLPVPAPAPVAEPAEADGDAAAPDAAEGDLPLTVPRRPYWLAALLVVVVAGVGVYFGRPYLTKAGTPPVQAEPEREPLRRARELLSQQPLTPSQIEEALRILRDEREVHNTPEVHRLLSRAYEGQNNRLRALGHVYSALRLAPAGSEGARSGLALSQLLSRLGHPHDACQAAAKVLAGRPEPDIKRQAEALLSTLHCPAPVSGSAAATAPTPPAH